MSNGLAFICVLGRGVSMHRATSSRREDSLVVWKLDRLGRNTKHLIEIAEDLVQRGIGLKTLTGFEFDTNTPHGRLALQMSATLAE
jgi:DNA invertase Pin-like site-specific DNA recombinase